MALSMALGALALRYLEEPCCTTWSSRICQTLTIIMRQNTQKRCSFFATDLTLLCSSLPFFLHHNLFAFYSRSFLFFSKVL